MAHQRRSERDRDGHGSGGGRRCLVHAHALLLTLLLGIAGCDAPSPTAPQQDGTIDFPSGISGGGNGQTTEVDALVGLWERFDAAVFETDVVTITTRWAFEGGGSCRRTITTFSAAEGFPRTTARDCTYDIGPLEITITFSDGEQGTFSLSFPGFDPDRMLLDGAEYRRVS